MRNTRESIAEYCLTTTIYVIAPGGFRSHPYYPSYYPYSYPYYGGYYPYYGFSRGFLIRHGGGHHAKHFGHGHGGGHRGKHFSHGHSVGHHGDGGHH